MKCWVQCEDLTASTEEGRPLHLEKKICATVSSLPLRAAINTSPVDAMTLQAGEQDISEKFSSHLLIAKAIVSLL